MESVSWPFLTKFVANFTLFRTNTFVDSEIHLLQNGDLSLPVYLRTQKSSLTFGGETLKTNVKGGGGVICSQQSVDARSWGMVNICNPVYLSFTMKHILMLYVHKFCRWVYIYFIVKRVNLCKTYLRNYSKKMGE